MLQRRVATFGSRRCVSTLTEPLRDNVENAGVPGKTNVDGSNGQPLQDRRISHFPRGRVPMERRVTSRTLGRNWLDVFSRLDPKSLQRRLLAVPVDNAPRKWADVKRPTPLDVVLPNFDLAEKAFAPRSFFHLFRSYVVLRVCGIQWIVDNADSLIRMSYSVLGSRLTNFVVRNTFFAQFCAAESEAGLQPVMRSLECSGISGILDYAAEADLDSSTEERDAEIVARTYEYEGERACDAATKVFEQCILTAANVAQHSTTRSRPFAAIKVTALGNPKLLKRLSLMITETRRLFQRMEDKLDRKSEGYLTLTEWRKAFAEYFLLPENPGDVDNLFWYALGITEEDWKKEHPGEEPKLDIIDWARSMNFDIITKLIQTCKDQGPLYKVNLSDEEVELAGALFQRLEKLAKLAHEQDVSLMIDAEQTYFQPCIDANVLRLQRIYNSDRATIFGTYQCYLKSADERLQQDLERSKREGWIFAAKLVRGAYMVAERKLAEEQGYPSPIHETIEDTHDCYHRNLDILLRDPFAEVMIATHNQKTCEFATAKMDEYNIRRLGGGVHFGQLLGMSDHITFTLGLCGYSAYKYLPYGKVEEVLPYLIRRAQENSGLMAGAVHERQIIVNEMKRRLKTLFSAK